jgi:hypothetical protein
MRPSTVSAGVAKEDEMTLRRLNANDLQALCIVPPPGGIFEFHEFDRGPYMEYREVVGIGKRSEDPLLLELRLMHIDEELLDDWSDETSENQGFVDQPPFDSFNEASGHIAPTPAELNTFIRLLETWTGEPLPRPDDTIVRFRRIERHKLTQLHVKPTNVKAEAAWYQYLSDEGIQAADEITLVHPPRWLAHSRYGREQHSWLEFAAFRRDRLDDPAFDPLDTWGLGRIVVNRPGLRELVTLLKQHSFEYMVGASQP